MKKLEIEIWIEREIVQPGRKSVISQKVQIIVCWSNEVPESDYDRELWISSMVETTWPGWSLEAFEVRVQAEAYHESTQPV